MKHISSETFGRHDGRDLVCVTLRNATGGQARILNWGAILYSWMAPGRTGKPEELTLGLPHPADYVKSNPPYFGAICGRVANRIAHGQFSLDGTDYALACNNGPNHLHGGVKGFDKHVWSALDVSESSVRLHRMSPHGEEGYPGDLDVSVTYSLFDDQRLRIEYTAQCDRPTLVNLTNHAYFNLSGGRAGDIQDHLITIRSSRYLPSDEHALATGKVLPVAGTPWDFRAPARLDGRPRGLHTGYDHCFALDAPGMTEAAVRLEDSASGRTLEMRTSEPGVHLYTGHYLSGVPGRDGQPLPPYAGVALEAEHFPDSIHHPEFPSVVLRPGETYRQTTEYRAGFGS